MLKKAITSLTTMAMTLLASGAFAGEASSQPPVKKWQPQTPTVQAKQVLKIKVKQPGTVMERPAPANEQVMEIQAAKELKVGGQRQIQKRIGPGPVA